MSKVGIIISSIIFGSMFIAGIILLFQHEVKNEELVEVSGVITNLHCPVGKFSSKPTVTLAVGNSELEFSLFQVFSEKLSCNGKEAEKSLIGSSALLKVISNNAKFSWAYEVYVNNKLVYGIADVKSEPKVTGFILVITSISILLLGMFKRQKAT